MTSAQSPQKDPLQALYDDVKKGNLIPSNKQLIDAIKRWDDPKDPQRLFARQILEDFAKARTGITRRHDALRSLLHMIGFDVLTRVVRTKNPLALEVSLRTKIDDVELQRLHKPFCVIALGPEGFIGNKPFPLTQTDPWNAHCTIPLSPDIATAEISVDFLEEERWIVRETIPEISDTD